MRVRVRMGARWHAARRRGRAGAACAGVALVALSFFRLASSLSAPSGTHSVASRGEAPAVEEALRALYEASESGRHCIGKSARRRCSREPPDMLLDVLAVKPEDVECRYEGSDAGSHGEGRPSICYFCRDGKQRRLHLGKYHSYLERVWDSKRTFELDTSKEAGGSCYKLVTQPADEYLSETSINASHIYIGEELDYYRLGDLIRFYGEENKKRNQANHYGFGYLLEGAHNDTIGAEYIRLSAGLSNPEQQRMDRAKRAVERIAARRGMDLSPSLAAARPRGRDTNAQAPTLVLHIRVGDALCSPREADRWSRYVTSIQEQIRLVHFKGGVSPALRAGAGAYQVNGALDYTKFGDDEFWTTLSEVLSALRSVRVVVIAGAHIADCLERSAMYLQSRHDWLARHPSVGEVELRLGQHPDEDVIIAASADVFVSTGGGFGKVLETLSSLFGGHALRLCGGATKLPTNSNEVLPKNEESKLPWVETVGVCGKGQSDGTRPDADQGRGGQGGSARGGGEGSQGYSGPARAQARAHALKDQLAAALQHAHHGRGALRV